MIFILLNLLSSFGILLSLHIDLNRSDKLVLCLKYVIF